MTASRRVTLHRRRRAHDALSPVLAGLAGLAGLAIVGVCFGCAGGGDDPGLAPDRCKARDCGPSSGGLDGDKLDGDEEEFDTEFPPEEDTAVADTRKPGLDTGVDAASPDTASADTPIDSAKVDSATPDTAPAIDTAPTCTIPTGKTCGWSPQCGCTAGQNCDFTSTDGSVACVAAGAVDRNGKCTALGQCKKGLTCVAGLCMPFCSVLADCPSGSTQLCHTVSGGTTDVPGLKVCMQQCDPRAPAAVCGAATACEIIDSAKGETTCTRSGTSTALAGCVTDVFACAAGYTCVGTKGDCLAWCRVGFPGDCTGGRTCYTFSDHPKIKAVEYGVCDF